MNITMNNVHMQDIEEVREFLKGNKRREFVIATREDKYEFIRDTLIGLRYKTLKKKDKGIVKTFLLKVTRYEDKQLKRLIQIWKNKGLRYTKRKAVGASVKVYKPEDIALLITTDILHKTPNGRAVKEILKREYVTFGKEAYATISGISVSHIYNIRQNNVLYTSSDALIYTKTKSTSVSIGERRKPDPQGRPGSVRVDSVHQGDKEGVKGVYHINMVDEVTQWEIVGCVPHISDEYMIPMLESMIRQFPFVIINFHSDNGSEYINRMIAEMLNRLLITQSKSRSRRTNDQALVEGKNGSVIRKHMGRNHISKENAGAINEFNTTYFNVYLNFHRISGYATDYTDRRGKIRKKYDQYMTPYNKLKLLPNASHYLRDASFELLDKTAYAHSDNDFAEKMRKAKEMLEKNYKKLTKTLPV
jgi:hypothetical protein